MAKKRDDNRIPTPIPPPPWHGQVESGSRESAWLPKYDSQNFSDCELLERFIGYVDLIWQDGPPTDMSYYAGFVHRYNGPLMDRVLKEECIQSAVLDLMNLFECGSDYDPEDDVVDPVALHARWPSLRTKLRMKLRKMKAAKGAKKRGPKHKYDPDVDERIHAAQKSGTPYDEIAKEFTTRDKPVDETYAKRAVKRHTEHLRRESQRNSSNVDEGCQAS